MADLETLPLEEFFITEDNINDIMSNFTQRTEQQLAPYFDVSKVKDSPFLRSCYKLFGFDVIQKRSNPEIERLREFLKIIGFSERTYRYYIEEELTNFFMNLFNNGQQADLSNPISKALFKLILEVGRDYQKLIGLPSGDKAAELFKTENNISQIPPDINEDIEKCFHTALSQKMDFHHWMHQKQMKVRRQQYQNYEKNPKEARLDPRMESRKERRKTRLQGHLEFYKQQIQFLKFLQELLKCGICIEEPKNN